MTKEEARKLLLAPFVTIEAYDEAKAWVLAGTTKNRRALFEQIPPNLESRYLLALLGDAN